MKFFLLLALLSSVVFAASSERINQDKMCENKARWAAEVYELIVENPKIVFSGMDREDVNAFAFIRNWVNEGKTRDDLMTWTRSHCLGTET